MAWGIRPRLSFGHAPGGGGRCASNDKVFISFAATRDLPSYFQAEKLQEKEEKFLGMAMEK